MQKENKIKNIGIFYFLAMVVLLLIQLRGLGALNYSVWDFSVAGIAPLSVLITSFFVAFFLGWFIIPKLSQLGLGQEERSDGPASHLKKVGTPSFGGFIFLAPFFIVILFLAFKYQLMDLFAIAFFVGVQVLIGFLDDLEKVKTKRRKAVLKALEDLAKERGVALESLEEYKDLEQNKQQRFKSGLDDAVTGGLGVWQKTFLQLFNIAFLTIYYLAVSPTAKGFWFWGLGFVEVVGIWKLPFGIFIAFFLFSVMNAVNITDGIDGLCSSVSVVAILASVLLSYRLLDFTTFSCEPSCPIGISGRLEIAMLALMMGLLAFLIFNFNPAKVFMGDTGSLGIGAALSAYLLFTGFPWFFLLLGVVYWVEIFSVLAQTTYYKATKDPVTGIGKRIIPMSPIHHSFESKAWGAWSEKKIVALFVSVAIIGALLALFTQPFPAIDILLQ